MKNRTLMAALALLLLTAPALAGEYLDKDKENRLYAEANEDRAVVYFVRPARAGGLIKFWAFIDDELVGASRGRSYFFTEYPAGSHMLWSKAENIATLELELEAGKTYFVEQKLAFGIGKARVKLVEIDAERGRELIAKLPYARLTDEGRIRGAEIAETRYAKALDKAAKR